MVTYTTLANLQMPGAMGVLAQAVNADPNLVGFGTLTSGIGLAGVMVIQSNATGNTTIGQSGAGGISAGGIGCATTTTPSRRRGRLHRSESSVGINLGVTPGGPALRSGATSITDGFTDDPLHIVRSTPADANNMIKVESLDRQNNYNTAGAETFEQGSIEVYGVRRDKSTKARLITDPLYVGGTVAQLLLLQRQLLYRNTYTFKLGWKYILLEPMDLVKIIDSRAGASALTVRITVVEEDDEGMLSITPEDFFGLFADRALPADRLFAILLALDTGGGRQHCRSCREAGEWRRGRRVGAELECSAGRCEHADFRATSGVIVGRSRNLDRTVRRLKLGWRAGLDLERR